MRQATDATVLGNFERAKFVHDGIETTFFKKDGKFWVRTDGHDGQLSDYEIRYTFGVTPLQQYLIEIPGGRLQALGIAWDARPSAEGGQRWYHLYPNRVLRAGDPLHWTGIEQNWNHQCAWCHSTNLRKSYNRNSRTFTTEWSEINVGCEACHGPASKHVAWASPPKGQSLAEDPAKGFEVRFDKRTLEKEFSASLGQTTQMRSQSTSKEVMVCATCHSRREQNSGSQKDVRSFFDAFRLSRLETPLYFVDGQQRDEVFNHGSFLQSKMHAAGVTCSDCHNPHSGKLRKTGNGVCLQCHASDKFDVAAHHRHAPNTTGARCVSCHMPTTLYMGVDARHDHSFRIPRPDRTVTLGTPNACNKCHADKSAQWAMDQITAWAPSKQHLGFQTFAEAFHLGDRGAPGAQSALIQIAEDNSLASYVRASAMSRLARYSSPRVDAAVLRALQSKDLDVRVAAIASVTRAGAATRAVLLAPLLKDESRIVRMDAARELAGDAERALSSPDKSNFEKAIVEFVEAQLFNADRPEALANLGALYLRRGMLAEARAALIEAETIDPTFSPATVALADLERATGDEKAAEEVLSRSIRRSPQSAPAIHALGLSLVRQRRHGEAIEFLSKAARLAPDEPRFTYVYAVAEHGRGNVNEAVAILKEALDRHPYDRDILTSLMSYAIETKDFSSALERAELLGRLEPERVDLQRLIAKIRREIR